MDYFSLGCRQGNCESTQNKGPACKAGPGKTSVSILLEVGTKTSLVTTSLFLISFLERSNTPIIYRAFPVWNVKVSNIVDELVRNNSETRWFVIVQFTYEETNLDISFTGCRRTLVRIVLEIGSRMRATGLYLGTAIGAPRSHCGSRMTLKKYHFHPP
jgi:hypothetical protein